MPISLPDFWHVEHLKLTGYLLNINHPYGWPKARAFLGYGFKLEDPERLAKALFEHVATVPSRVLETEANRRFIFEGPMQAPAGTIPRLRSVWLAEACQRGARLITAYPFD